MNMVDFQRCSYLLKQTRLGQWFKLHDSFVCAGGEEGKDTCTVSSSSDLMIAYECFFTWLPRQPGRNRATLNATVVGVIGNEIFNSLIYSPC